MQEIVNLTQLKPFIDLKNEGIFFAVQYLSKAILHTAYLRRGYFFSISHIDLHRWKQKKLVEWILISIEKRWWTVAMKVEKNKNENPMIWREKGFVLVDITFFEFSQITCFSFIIIVPRSPFTRFSQSDNNNNSSWKVKHYWDLLIIRKSNSEWLFLPRCDNKENHPYGVNGVEFNTAIWNFSSAPITLY